MSRIDEYCDGEYLEKEYGIKTKSMTTPPHITQKIESEFEVGKTITKLTHNKIKKALQESYKEGKEVAWSDMHDAMDKNAKIVRQNYAKELMEKIDKLHQDERPVDCIDGKTPVETYGYEETHNNALKQVKEIINQSIK